jgi:hypothetical protein
MHSADFSERILSRLELAEAHEPNPHFQCDLRIAWITVLYASHGYLRPHVCASYRVLGLHPEKVWPALVARRRAMRGSLYEQFFGGCEGVSSDSELPPKKPVVSAGIPPCATDRRAA